MTIVILSKAVNVNNVIRHLFYSKFSDEAIRAYVVIFITNSKADHVTSLLI